MSEYELTKEILKLSKSDNWDDAKLEWGLRCTIKVDFLETCLCGHYPIVNVCIIENAATKCTARVGNCCVKKFMNKKISEDVESAGCISCDLEKSLNDKTIQFVRDKGWINDWEYKFLTSTMHKRKLSDKQLQMRISINRKILARASRP